MLPEHRTRALSLFMFGGSLGLAIGPTLSGLVVSRFGLAGLPYLVLPILALVLALSWTGGFLQLPRKAATRVQPHATSSFDGKPVLALLLLMACSLRIVPNMAMDKVLAFVMERQGHGPSTIGLTQTLFLASASAGMFAMVFRFRHGWERPSMIWCPLAGIPLLAMLGWEGCPRWLFLALLVPSGLILWGTTPAMVSYAQQLFPRSSGLASAITLGISWGLAGLIQAPVTAYYQSTGVPQHAFFALIPCLIVGAWAAWMLPATHQLAAAAPADGVTPAVAELPLRPEFVDA
jgi:MFS family permease